MPTYTIGLKKDPNDFESSNPPTMDVVRVTASDPGGPITDVEPTGTDDQSVGLYQLALSASHEYEDYTNQIMTPNQMVRFFGQSALLTDQKD